jgi:hypothetical protein
MNMHFREQCFAAAMEICSESESAEVVHGWVPGGPGFVVHAWAEVEDGVYDLTESDHPMRKADYYAHMGVRPELTRRYSRVEYFTLMAETGSFGPFDKDLFFANETAALGRG